MSVLNLTEIQRFCRTGEIDQMKADLAEQSHDEWPLVFFAISDAITSIADHIESLSKLDPGDSEKQKNLIEEIYRNNFFARQLIKDYRKEDPQIGEFKSYLSSLEFSLGTAGEESESFLDFQNSVSETFRSPLRQMLTGNCDPEYVTESNQGEKLILKLQAEGLEENLLSLLTRLFESSSVFKASPLPRCIECVVDLDPGLEPEFYIPNFENDSVKIQFVYDKNGECLGTYSFPVDENLDLPAEGLNRLVKESGFNEIQKQLTRIFERYFDENKEIQTEIDCFNAVKENTSQASFFYFSFGFEKESPTD